MIFPCELYHTAPPFCWWIEPGESFNKKVRKTLRIDIIMYMTYSSTVLTSVVSWALRPQTFLCLSQEHSVHGALLEPVYIRTLKGHPPTPQNIKADTCTH